MADTPARRGPVPLDPRLLLALRHASDATIRVPEPLSREILQLLAAPPRPPLPARRPWRVALAAMLVLAVAGLGTFALHREHAGRAAPPPLLAGVTAPAILRPAVAPAEPPLPAATAASAATDGELPPDEAAPPNAAASLATSATPSAAASPATSPAALPATAPTPAPAAHTARTPAGPASAVAATVRAAPPPPSPPASAAPAPAAAPAAQTAQADPPSPAGSAAPASAAPVARVAPSRSGPGAAEWSKVLQLPTLKDVPWRLGLAFETINRIELDGRSRNATAQNCRELLAALDAGLLMSLSQDVPAANFEAVTCRAIALISRAGRATRSDVESLRLDAASVPRLPAEVATAVDAAGSARLAAASARQQPLSALFPDLRSRLQGDTLVLAAGNWESRLHLLARGDFDHDGQDDLLLSVIERTVDNRYENTKLFIVNRDAPDAPLRVVRQVQ